MSHSSQKFFEAEEFPPDSDGFIIFASTPEVRRAFTANPMAKESPGEHPSFSKKSELPLSEKAVVPNMEQKRFMAPKDKQTK